MRIDIVSLFPEFFDAFFNHSIIKRAIEAKRLSVGVTNPRDFSHNKHGQVDDTPYGGGAGMLMMAPPIFEAVESVIAQYDSDINDTYTTDEMCDEMSLIGNPNESIRRRIIFMGPTGQPFTQEKARELASYDQVVLICGHYEGFDERIRDYVDIQMSLGDFVLTGGESACMVMCDCILRILPGVIRQDSSDDDSFSNGLLEYPQYTRPEIYDGKRVPDVLLSGHHANIKKYRHEESLKRTAMYRPDLLENLNLNKEDQKVVDSVLKIKK
mgnify:CR=1 FL=1